MRIFRALVVSVMLFATVAPVFCASGPVITVATDSSLQFVIDELLTDFESTTGFVARPVIGSTATLADMIRGGAEIDMLLAADTETPDVLKAERLAAGDVIRFAHGALSLWSFRMESVIDGPSALTLDTIQKIGIPAPDRSPYGAAAMAALTHYNLYDIVSPKLINADDTTRTAAVLMNGSVDAVIIARSVAASKRVVGTGYRFDIPASAHPPIRMSAVRLTASPMDNRDPVRALLAYLTTPRSGIILTRNGFILPTEVRHDGQ